MNSFPSFKIVTSTNYKRQLPLLDTGSKEESDFMETMEALRSTYL